MKKMNNLLKTILFLVLILGYNGANAQPADTSFYECNHLGTVYDYTGFDGCGFVIDLDDGDYLEVVEIDSNFLLVDSMRVRVGYEPIDGILTTCMVGTPVSILCIEEYVDTSYCMAEFGYSEINFMFETLVSDTTIAPTPGPAYQFIDKSIGNVINWEWYVNDSVFSTDPDPIYIFTTPGLYTICLQIETANGCSSTTCHTILIDTIGDCQASFWYYPVDYPVWGEDSVILDNGKKPYYDDSTDIIYNEFTYQFINTSVGANIDSYAWDFGDGDSAFVANPVHSFPGPGEYYVWMEIRSSVSGCYSSMYEKIVIDTMSFNCKASFISCNYTVLGDSLYKNDTIFNDSLPVSRKSYVVGFKNLSQPENGYFSWEFGDGTYSYDKNPVHMYQSPGSYNVCLTIYSEYGCYDTYCQTVNVGFDECNVEFTYNIAVPDCEGFQIAHAFMSPPTDDIRWYSWDFGDGNYAWESNPFHIFENYGVYDVCLEVQFWNGCIARSCQKVGVWQDVINNAFEKSCGLSPVKELEANEPLALQNIYPVPAYDQLNFVINSTMSQNAQVQIFGLDGRVYSLGTKINLIEGENSLTLPLEGLTTGVYFYKVVTNEGTLEGQFTVVH